MGAAVRLRAEVGRRIVGQRNALDEILIAMLAGGHALLVGVPGLAKTLMIRSVAEAFHLDFRRIQFTPDLVPSDITGTEILEEDAATGGRSFRFAPGPIFATSCWPTRSIARRRARRRPCSKRCRNIA
jgi:MoxR-like ATPase